MQDSSHEFPAPFKAYIERMKAAAEREDFTRVLELADEAIAWASEHGDREAVQRAQAIRCGVQLVISDCGSVARTLQPILMGSRLAENRHLAAYNLSILYDRRRLYDKSAFYARIALENAEKAGDPLFVLNSWNRLGNVQIIQSYFEDARETYRRAAALLSATIGPNHAVVATNLGYCHLILGQHRRGFRQLFKARRVIRHLGLPQLEARIGLRLAFTYGYIELDRIRPAQRHAGIALEQGEASGDRELTLKALYLLGEVEKKAGDHDRALAYFERLQRDYYPEQPDLPDLLMAVETHRLVNLRA